MPSYEALRRLAERSLQDAEDAREVGVDCGPSCDICLMSRGLLAALDRLAATRNGNPNRVEANHRLRVVNQQAEEAERESVQGVSPESSGRQPEAGRNG